MSGDHPNYSTIENGQNTEKSPVDLLSLKLKLKNISLNGCEKLSWVPNHDKIGTLGENETDKYFGILEADTIEPVDAWNTYLLWYFYRNLPTHELTQI